MKANDLICTKLETLLGSNYKLFPISHFNKKYTEAREYREGENVSYINTYNSDYGTLRKDKIIGIVSLTNAIRNNSANYYLSASYKIEFSVPRNIEIIDKYDNAIQAPSIDFESDIENLINGVLNQVIELDETYKCKMTMSEPTYIAVETDGEFTYEILQVSGNIIITDKAKFGSDYVIKLLVYNNSVYEYVELDDVNSFNEIMNNNGNAISKQGKAKLEQNVSQSSWVCTCSIDDMETTNKARKKLYEIVHQNLEFVNPNDEIALKRKQRVKITTPHGDVHLFDALVNVDFHTTKNGNGSYDISFTDDNKEIASYEITFSVTFPSMQFQSPLPPSPKTVKYRDEVTDTVSCANYKFDGWQIDGVNVGTNFVYNYKENKTATALWKPFLDVNISEDGTSFLPICEIEDVQLYYTLDGTTPTTSSAYIQPLTIPFFRYLDVAVPEEISSVGYTLKILGFKDGQAVTDLVVATYPE